MRNYINSTGSLLSMVALAAANDAGADPLADLGLDVGTEEVGTPAAETPVEEATDASDEGEKKTRVQVKVGEVVDEVVDLIPDIKRGGGSRSGESKYDFSSLAAPQPKEDGGFLYATRTVLNVEGQELDRLQRSVQSAVTAQNRAAKDAKEETRFITRTKVTDGEAVGIIVFRVDNTLDGE